MKNIGRNDPCPCGSGKKYKKCCGRVPESKTDYQKAIESVDLVKRIAYLGSIGRQRKEFCENYIVKKQAILHQIETLADSGAFNMGKSISCHEGCYFCCAEPIKASLHECESIVHFLYQNDAVLRHFIEAYPRWREIFSKHKGLLEELDRLQVRAIDADLSESAMRDVGRVGEVYTQLLNYCPFLVDKACSIYSVRPLVCASVYATTPSEWCDPTIKHPIEELWVDSPTEYFPLESTIYGKPYEAHYITYMPWFVFSTLTAGLQFISANVPGLENLWAEFLRDSEVADFGRQLRQPS